MSSVRPISAVFQEIIGHLTEIIRSEVRLARAELRQDAADVGRASVLLVIGGLMALYTFGLILLAAVYALNQAVAPWASALIVGGAVGIAAAVFLVIGRQKLKAANLRPEKTIQSLQENVTWMKNQTR